MYGLQRMDAKIQAEWVRLAERLIAAGPDKFDEVISGLRDVVEAQEIIDRWKFSIGLHRRCREIWKG